LEQSPEFDAVKRSVAKYPKLMEMLLSIMATANAFFLEHRTLVTPPFYLKTVLQLVQLRKEKKAAFINCMDQTGLLINSWPTNGRLDCVFGSTYVDALLPQSRYQTSVKNRVYDLRLLSGLGRGGHGEAFAVENIHSHERCALKRLIMVNLTAPALANAFDAEENVAQVESPWVLRPTATWFDQGCIHVRCFYICFNVVVVFNVSSAVLLQLLYSSEPLSFSSLINTRTALVSDDPFLKAAKAGEKQITLRNTASELQKRLLGANGEDALLGIAASSFLGLGKLHDQRICHADLKPENLLVGSKGGVICTLQATYVCCLSISHIAVILLWTLNSADFSSSVKRDEDTSELDLGTTGWQSPGMLPRAWSSEPLVTSKATLCFSAETINHGIVGLPSDVFGLSLIFGRTAAAQQFDVKHLAELKPVANQAALRAMRKPVVLAPQADPATQLDDGSVFYWEYPPHVLDFMNQIKLFFGKTWITGGMKVFFLRTLFEPDPVYRLTCADVLQVRLYLTSARHCSD
jgi:hypothetical protein